MGTRPSATSTFSQADLKVLRCGDPTCSTGNTIAVVDPEAHQFTSMALDAENRPVVAFTDLNAPGGLKVLRCGNPMCTAGNTTATPDPGNNGSFPSLVLDETGDPVVAYWDSETRELKLLRCGNSTCTTGNSLTLPEPSGDTGTYPSIELDATGNPVVAYQAGLSQLRLLHCGNADCTAGNTIETVDSVGDVGFWTSLELDSSGSAVISYVDGIEGERGLKVAHCGDPSCSSGNVITTADAGLVGPFSSIALDAGGRPIVSYIDSAKSALRVLHCGNSTCSAGSTIARIDSSGEDGYHTSLVLDGSGSPIVSYYNLTQGDLRVLSCGDPACGAGTGSDYDKDTLLDNSDPDDDNDGCTDTQELQPEALLAQGGGRNPYTFWDFFDTPTGAALARDKSVRTGLLRLARTVRLDGGYGRRPAFRATSCAGLPSRIRSRPGEVPGASLEVDLRGRFRERDGLLRHAGAVWALLHLSCCRP